MVLLPRPKDPPGPHGFWGGVDSTWTVGAELRDGARGDEFLAFGGVEARGGTCACYDGDLRMVEASVVFWVFLVGGGDSGYVGESGVCTGVWGCFVGVF